MKNETKKTILIVDDARINIDIMLDLLDPIYDVVVSLSPIRALEIVKETHIDLILLDIIMPEMNGYEVCSILKKDEKSKSIPIIFITSNSDEESINRAYELGGIDYVTKPFKPLELLARIKTHLTMQTLISDLEKSQKELELLSLKDHMTQLYNRRYFSVISDKILDLAMRSGKSLSVMMLDIDKFKNVNDTYGHHIGDKVIIALADVLQTSSRKSDVVCRFGGEEFLFLLPDTAVDGAYILAEKIRQRVEEMEIEIEDKKIIKYTVSIGISAVKVREDRALETSIQRADGALYEAKESGRNRVCINEIS